MITTLLIRNQCIHVSIFEREPLLAPLGFKGSCLDELWQTAALMEGAPGHKSIGLGTQSVLWSDANVFSTVSEKTLEAYNGPYWEVAWQIPFAYLEKYYGKMYFSAGKRMKANFYKCGNEAEFPLDLFGRTLAEIALDRGYYDSGNEKLAYKSGVKHVCIPGSAESQEETGCLSTG